MKTNKKAILGFALAMVFSLAIMQGNSIKGNKQDANLAGVGIGLYYGNQWSENPKTAVAGASLGALIANYGYGTITAAGWTGWGAVVGGGLVL